MKPCRSPSPCTVLGSPTTDDRTPRAAMPRAALAFSIRPATGEPGADSSRSVATCPGNAGVPEAMTRGLPEPSSAPPIVSMARRSAVTDASKSVKSWMNARWMTPSEPLAPARKVSRSFRSPRSTSAPAAAIAAAESSDLASPRTW